MFPRLSLWGSILLATGLLPTASTGQIRSEIVASGFTDSIYLTAPEGETERLFVVERFGVIHIIKNGTLLAEPFLDIQDQVESVAPPYEMGLLGLAFDPGYDTNGHFYVYYTPTGPTRTSVIHRFTVSANPDSADENSLHPILQIDQPTSQHNGGTVLFGPDGYLYLGLGESNFQNQAQDPQTLLGKMLRIDVGGDDFPTDPLRNYAIPPDNPFVDSTGVADEIWAFGLRNPYRFNFDRVTGDLYIGDVGQTTREEINFQPAAMGGGENYGWPFMEGTFCFDPPVDCNDGTLTIPVHDYDHLNCAAVTGGSVYRGSAIPGLWGHYIFADFCQSSIWSFKLVDGVVTEFTDRSEQLRPEGEQPLALVAAIEEGGDGELYIVTWTFASNGAIYKIVPDPVAVGVNPSGLSVLDLSGGSPNPFARTTRFELRPQGASDIHVSVFSASGRLIRQLYDGRTSGRTIALEWSGLDESERRVAAGVYFIRAESGSQAVTKRVTLVR